MDLTPYQPRSRRELLRALLAPGLALALAALLSACGGGSDSAAPSGKTAQSAMFKALSTSPETVLTPVSATASAVERGDLSAAAAIDHDETTRWSSGFTDDQYLTLDFGQSVPINRVHIDWENAHATQYLLQVSDDNATWTTIQSVDNSQGGSEDWPGLNGQGRYLRMLGVKRSTQYGYSIFEIQAFSGTPVLVTPPPVDAPPPDLSKPGVAIQPVTATSSALENAGMSAAMAIDGNLSTRWGSAFEDGAWIQFDFGAKTPVGYMKLQWQNAYGKEYALNVSDDGVKW